MSTNLSALDSAQLARARAALADQVPLLRRVVDLDATCLARVQLVAGTVAVFARLPFGVLVARTVPVASPVPAHGEVPFVQSAQRVDRTVLARELLVWVEDESADQPAARDADWRGALPPTSGWRRVDSVPDHVVRDLVRKGAAALQDAADREGVPGAQPRSTVADSLLDAIVLTATSDTTAEQAAVSLRSLSALTRMGFLAPVSRAHIDLNGRWTRVAATYGSVFAERTGLALSPR